MKRLAGFTLIEMTVALALLGFVSLLLFESLRFGQRSYQSATRKGAHSWQVFAAHRFLRNLVEEAYPQQYGEAGLQGDAQRLFLTAPAPQALGGGGMYRYELALRESSMGESDLVMRWRPQITGAVGAEATGAEEVILEHVAGLQLSYQGAAGWSTSWAGPELPKLVRLQVTFSRSDSRMWPEMIAGPRVTDDANCVFDAVAQRCRST